MWVGFKRKLQIVVKAIIAYTLTGVVAAGLIYLIYPETFMDYVPAMGAFFVIAGILLSLKLDRSYRNPNPKRITNIYMLSRIIKLVLTLLFLWICVEHTDWEKKPFGISLMIFYMSYMFLDQYVYMLFSKKRKKADNALKK